MSTVLFLCTAQHAVFFNEYSYLSAAPHLFKVISDNCFHGCDSLFIFDYNIDSDILVITESLISSIVEDKGRISFYAIRDGIMV